MSTAPTGWQSPVTTWTPASVPAPADLNRIEGNAGATEAGSRTVDPAEAPASNAGTLRQFLDWFANRIGAVTGGTNWYDAPDTTLAAAKTHADAAAPHSGHETPAGAQGKVNTHNAIPNSHLATSSAAPSRIILRDAAGRAQVAAPAASDDIARKSTVDDHNAVTNPHSATSAATANRIILRDASGRAKVNDPAVAADIATKGYVDSIGTSLVETQRRILMGVSYFG